MKKLVTFDSNGFYVSYEIVEDETIPKENQLLFELSHSHNFINARLVNGELVEGATAEELEFAKADHLKIAQQLKIDELKLACNKSIYDGFISTLKKNDIFLQFGFNEKDQLNFNSQMNRINLWKNQLIKNEITKAEYDAKFPISWKSLNLGVIQMTETEFIQVSNDAEKHLYSQQGKYWQLEHTLNNLKDIEAVKAIKW